MGEAITPRRASRNPRRPCGTPPRRAEAEPRSRDTEPGGSQTTTPITLAATDITETDTRTTRLEVLEAQICQVRDDLAHAAAAADPGYALDASVQLATLLQHTLQEIACLARETSPR